MLTIPRVLVASVILSFCVIGLATAQPTPAPNWMMTGGKDYAQLGFQVASAGDVDGDGFADFLIGAPFYDSNIGGPGRAFLVRGSRQGPSVNDIAQWSITGETSSGELGFAVAGAGDLNGDGFADFAIGAPQDGASGAGRVLVFLGSPSGPGVVASAVLDSDQRGSGFGNALAGAGDVNGDGYDDLIVGQPYYMKLVTDPYPRRVPQGRVLIYLGGASGLSTTPAMILEPETFNSNFGFSVAGVGDLNGDGRDDIVVGAPMYDNGADATDNSGKIYVYLGNSNGVEAEPAWSAIGPKKHSLFGGSVAGAGDVNGDGFRDVVVGARTWSSVINAGGGESDEGLVEVFLGSASGLGASPAWMVPGPVSGSNFGISVAGGVDVNGDGFSDVLVGAPGVAHGEYDEGQVMLFYGSATSLATTPGWVAESNQPSGKFGLSVAFAGDVDGDGLGDILLGTESYHDNFLMDGSAFLYSGASVVPVTGLPRRRGVSPRLRENASPLRARPTVE